jgi:hypothetical protein
VTNGTYCQYCGRKIAEANEYIVTVRSTDFPEFFKNKTAYANIKCNCHKHTILVFGKIEGVGSGVSERRN